MKIKAFLVLLGLVPLQMAGPLPSAGETNKAVALTVVVMDTAGGAIPSAQIRLIPGSAMPFKNPETNEAGKISLEVLPGNYNLFVAVPVFLPWAKQILVDRTENQTVNVVLQIAETTQTVETCAPCFPVQTDALASSAPPLQSAPPVLSASLTMAVTDATGRAVPNAQIGGIPQSKDWKFAETDDSGKLIAKLAPRAYDIAVTSPGFQRWTKRVVLKEEEDQTVKVVLQTGECIPGPCGGNGPKL